jgi:hypothetical protein
MLIDPYHRAFSVAPDDRTFIMLRSDSSAVGPGSLTISLHWLAGARRAIARADRAVQP